MADLENRIKELEEKLDKKKASRPNVRFNTFSNEPDEDFLVFKQHLKTVVKLNGYDDEQSRLALAAAMKGKAAAAVLDINVLEENSTFENILESYEDRFLPTACSQMARMKFDAARQGNHEGVLDFHARLRTLYSKAYPDAADNVLLIRRFTLGLRRKEVRSQVMRGQPLTYTAALEMAQNETSVLQLVRISELGAAAPGVEPMEIGALGNDHRHVRCFNCKRLGHTKANCRVVRRDPPQDQGRQEGRGNPRGQGGPGNRFGRPGGGNPGRNQLVAALQELMKEDYSAEERPSLQVENHQEDF